jgi:putative FmdB family regulatory protein
VPIYEYRCEECGKRSSSLLPSYSTPDPACPHCGKPSLRRLVSTFATVSSGDGDGGADDFDGSGGDDDFGGGDDSGSDYGDDDF